MECPKCEVGEIRNGDDIVREGRKFITCILNGLNIKFMVIDNGIKYQAMFYVETTSEDIKNLLSRVVDCFNDTIKSLPNELRDYLKPRVKSFDDTYVIMFNNEFITIKAIW
ncbi:hypothetical protein B7L70_08740 [Vulcanisaeta sp. EB80]|uniref:hypothetical protein n=1 Tax=Vulcanisaeta sp. EB80 TaxID=1650660 RepID=UPI0009C1A419|nr:hypothetical protein [Vulcanisaeta sp. EB80]PLC67422.1 hypothetical protein B7L70_08740 [Vulcanisaeta sp. EB80]